MGAKQPGKYTKDRAFFKTYGSMVKYITVTNRYTKSGYIKDPEALHLYVRDIRIITPE